MNIVACSPISDEDWPAEIVDMKDGFASTLNVYRTMAHHPALLRAWASLRQHIVKDSSLGAERSELTLLRIAHRVGSDYEWAHHVARSREIGISDSRITAMRGVSEGTDGLIARAVDALLDQKKLSASLEAELATVIGRKAIFDMMATVGFYLTLGFILLTYDTPIDNQTSGVAKTFPRT